MVDAVSEEREELRRTVRDFLADKSSESEVRRLMATDEGYDAAVWRQMAEQLGCRDSAIPEEYGGHGYSFLELSVVFEEMGRALLCAPFFSTVALAAPALLAGDNEPARKEHLPRIASGELIATLALTEENAGWEEPDVTTRATADGDDFRIDGDKFFVIDGHLADLVLVAARGDTGVGLYAVRGDAAGLTRTAMVTMDETRKMARLSFEGTPAARVGDWSTVRRTLELAAAALASEQVGGAQRCLEMAADYARERVQFGRPIGSFQAVKHKLANMLMEVEQARSAAYYAAREAAENGPDLSLAASMAKSYCSDAYVHAAADNIQVHGGIGFTWEHPAHLYFKRAKSSQLLLGHPSHHRALVADRVGI